MNPSRVKELLDRVAAGSTDPQAALEELRALPFSSVDHALVDSHRELRTGIPEVVFGQGKTPDQILGIVERLQSAGQSALVTRLDAASASFLTERLDGAVYHPEARVLRAGPSLSAPLPEARVAVVSAGTADRPVAMEAVVTLEFLGVTALRFEDVGVAGLHRLLVKLPELQRVSLAIVVAGMEGALPSVVGGLVDFPVIAVPTSVGYGASFGGLAALLAMMNSCAAGVTVVNVDNGFGAAVAATAVLRTAARLAAG
ncbi:MAG: nickel pincer cofactor biosynthesis protein LarB [Myxococcales bacterium]|nr:MAG: nickel pincer cofactor biosynthesis protein LarB [Myxococcales bacterium]